MKTSFQTSRSLTVTTRRAVTALLKRRMIPGLLLLLACLSAGAQTHEWTWMGGSSVVSQPGVYGTQGKFAPANIPSSRSGAATWTDSSDNLWLFGGYGLDGNGSTVYITELWEFNPLINQWAWMSGGGNIGIGPGPRQGASTWTDSSGRLWLFGGSYGNGSSAYLNDLWEFDPSTNQWTRITETGSDDGYGVYGVLGIPGTENFPGSRSGATTWADSSGRLWLFGGYGYAAVGDISYLNDLWQFDPSTNQWTWVSGSSVLPCPACAQPGVYGTLGTPAPGNVPGGRNAASGWIDASGHLWLFAGYGDDAAGHDGYLNDLWEFNPSTGEWTWTSGSYSIKQPGVYGTLGTAATGNLPGSRANSVSWVDTGGHFWLFGGSGFDAIDAEGDLNDLWEFNPSTSQWTWMGGISKIDSKGGQPGVYGTGGTAAAGNLPGGRDSAASWTDANGHFWLFGGNGYDSKDASGYLNDLWRYEPIAQTASTTKITASPNPAILLQSVTFTATVNSSQGAPPDGETVQFMLGTTLLGTGTMSDGVATFSTSALAVGKNPIVAQYGGDKDLAASSSPALSQVVNRQTSSTELSASPNPASYGALATFTAQVTTPLPTIPPTGTVTLKYGTETLETATVSNSGAAAFTYLALPQGTDAITAVYNGDTNYLASTSNAIKQAVTAEITGDWTFLGESDNNAGVYGTLGTPAVGNGPGKRYGAANWTGSDGQLWLFSGTNYGSYNLFSDLWKLNPATGEWTWAGGSSQQDQAGVYGALGKAAATNIPGARFGATSWTDKSGNFWLFGGSGYDAKGAYGTLNDLWEFNPATMEWTWIGGSNILGANGVSRSGVYGKLGVAAPANVPGGRTGAPGAVDGSGNLWLFGGTENNNELNDLWEFNPATKEWTWASGSSSANQPGVYGTLGTAAPGNVPGARGSGSLWIDSSGNLWVFGGSNAVGYMNDLWEFNTSTKEWTWVSGSSAASQPGTYGTLGKASAANAPGARYGASNWKDNSGNILLFGGYGAAGSGNFGYFNDFWQFSPNTREWTWIGGKSTLNDPGNSGTLGIPAAGNLPGNRTSASSWTGSGGQLWLFGGAGIIAGGGSGTLNDLWQFQLPVTTPAAAPTFSAPAGTYTASLTVSIKETTPGATIHYTTDGTAPTAKSGSYTGPIKVTEAATVKAIAIAPGRPASALAAATYTILKTQTVAFTQPVTTVTYGVKPIALAAKSSSGLAVTFSVISGPARLSGSTLTVTGAGTIVLAVNQPGNSTYAPAKQVEEKLTVDKAKLTVTANNLTMKRSAAVPNLTSSITGFVNQDTLAKATTGKPALSTTATSKSPSGSYPIATRNGTLTAPNYTVTFVNGKVTVTE